MKDKRFRLVLADAAGLKWAQQTVKEHHYMQKKVSTRSRPIAYIMYVDGVRVGCFIFNRMQSSRCGGWYGPYKEVETGKYPMSQWEIINLARVWLSPLVQRKDSPLYVEHAATMAISEALKRVVYDYLVLHPPAYFDEPWQLKQCVSYCEARRFFCTVYLAANFTLKRVNKRDLRTYVRPLRPLKGREIRKIKQASLLSASARKKRAAKQFQETMKVVPMFGRRQLHAYLEQLQTSGELIEAI